jgi:hypothetical protein
MYEMYRSIKPSITSLFLSEEPVPRLFDPVLNLDSPGGCYRGLGLSILPFKVVNINPLV